MLEKQEFAQLRKQWVPLQKPTEDALIKSGYVRWRDMGTMRAFELTPEGKKYFENTQGLFALPAMTMETTKVMPVVPIKILIKEVTGITDGRDGVKVVDYTWNFDGSAFPPEAKQFFAGGVQGQATFKMYDDGWRILSY